MSCRCGIDVCLFQKGQIIGTHQAEKKHLRRLQKRLKVKSKINISVCDLFLGGDIFFFWPSSVV